MSHKVAVRTGKDRIRYTLCFEATLMMLLVPAGALFFDKSLLDIGLLGCVLVTKAMLVGLLYNWVFDMIDARAGRVSSDRSTIGRLVHATGFEISLTLTSLPIYIYWLDVTILEALAADIVVTTFVVAYTYVYTLAYDRLFPVQNNPVPA